MSHYKPFGPRKATSSDMVDIHRWIIEFNSEYYGRPLDHEKTTQSLLKIIEYGVCFVSTHGFIGGMIVETPFHYDKALVELGWYARGGDGLKLLDAFIKEGWKRDVDEIRMTTLDTSPEVADKVLIKRGFSVAETSYRLRPKE